MKKIYLIDGNSFIYRMFFALPEFSTADWTIVNALFWMAKFFVISLVKENPDYIVFVKDAKWENFRHKLYADYKATRDRMPDNLRSQIGLIEDMIRLMEIDIVEIEWYEADDVIGTLATQLWKDSENQVYILSWDKDLYSLTTSNVFIYDTMKKKVFNDKLSKEKFWVDSKKIIDYLAIVWDKADNIPGIDWFGPKKAVDLINIIWTVEEIYDVVEKVDSWEKIENLYPDLDEDTLKPIKSCFKWKTFEKLTSSKEDAFLSKKLATIDLNVDLSDFHIDNYLFDKEKMINDNLIEFFKKYEFNSLLWDDDKLEKMKKWDDLWLEVYIIDSKEKLDKLFASIKKEEKIVLDTETTSLSIIEAELVWVSIYLDDKRIYYINRLHAWKWLDDSDLQEFLEKVLSLDILIVWHNIKYDLEIIDLFLKKSDYNKSENKQTSLLI